MKENKSSSRTFFTQSGGGQETTCYVRVHGLNFGKIRESHYLFMFSCHLVPCQIQEVALSVLLKKKCDFEVEFRCLP